MLDFFGWFTCCFSTTNCVGAGKMQNLSPITQYKVLCYPNLVVGTLFLPWLISFPALLLPICFPYPWHVKAAGSSIIRCAHWHKLGKVTRLIAQYVDICLFNHHGWQCYSLPDPVQTCPNTNPNTQTASCHCWHTTTSLTLPNMTPGRRSVCGFTIPQKGDVFSSPRASSEDVSKLAG